MSNQKSWAVFLLACLLVLSALPTALFIPVYASVGEQDSAAEDADEEQEEPEEPEEQETQASQSDKADEYKSQITALDSELDKLEAERKKIQQQINSITGTKEKAEAEKSYIDDQMYITQSEIFLLESRILLLEQDVELKILQIAEKQAEYDYNFEQFRQRLRAMQMTRHTSALGLVLGADSFSDFLTKSDAVVRVAQHDREMMDALTAQREELETQKETLEATKVEVESDRALTQDKKQELSVRQKEASLRVQDLAKQEAEFKANLAENQAREREVQAEMTRIYQQIQWDENPYIGGEMAWPVPGYSLVTSDYGWRFGGTDLHTGIDISGSGVHGANIVAANSGRVVKVNWAYTAGRGYGVYVMLDHGGGMSTLYAHCSNILVSEGDVVAKGQPIALVGSTGWSTGPHLHFEVRKNGQHTDPKAYIY